MDRKKDFKELINKIEGEPEFGLNCCLIKIVEGLMRQDEHTFIIY